MINNRIKSFNDNLSEIYNNYMEMKRSKEEEEKMKQCLIELQKTTENNKNELDRLMKDIKRKENETRELEEKIRNRQVIIIHHYSRDCTIQ